VSSNEYNKSNKTPADSRRALPTNPAPKKQPVKRKPKRKSSPAKRQRIAAVLILLLTLYLVISLLIGGFIYFSFNKTGKSGNIYSLRLYHAEKRTASFDSNTVNNTYGLYVPFTALSEICGLGIAGDDGTVIILLSPDGGTIECINNSSLVYINENAVRLSAPVLFEAEDYKIPIDLIESYLSGVEVNYDKTKMLCTVTAPEKSENITLKVQIPKEISKPYFPDEYKTYSETSDISQ